MSVKLLEFIHNILFFCSAQITIRTEDNLKSGKIAAHLTSNRLSDAFFGSNEGDFESPVGGLLKERNIKVIRCYFCYSSKFCQKERVNNADSIRNTELEFSQ